MTGARKTSPQLLVMILTLMVGLVPVLATAQSTPIATPEVEPETGPRFVLRPAEGVDGSFFSLEAEAGSTHTLSAVIENADDEPLSLRTYAADGFTLVNGGFGVRSEDEPQTDVATWLAYEAETLTLEPDQGIEREITVNVPDDAAPGEYIAGIVLQTDEPIEIEGSAMFDQIVRKSVAVFITVPGEMTPGFDVGEPEILASASGVRLSVPVQNTGNMLVRPVGELVLTDASGNTAFTQQVAMGSVYAGMETTVELPLPVALPEGDYAVSLSMSDEETGQQASVDGAQVTLSREIAAEAPLEISAATVEPMPSADEVQFAAVSVTVENRELPVEGAQLVLDVSRDGEPVEEFVLAQAVTLQQGETTIEQRYLPLEGWSAGEWSFSVTLQSVDPQTGAEATLLTTEIDSSIMIGE